MVNLNLLPSRDIGGLPGVMMILFVAFGGLLFGYDTGTISGVSLFFFAMVLTMRVNCSLYFLPSIQHVEAKLFQPSLFF